IVPVGYEELDKELMSDSPEINKFIKENDGLRWIPYEQLSNIEYLAHGGFGVVSKARWKSSEVALKCLNNSKNLTADILQEITNYRLFDHRFIIYVNQCYGISQDPATGNYLMVMHYFECDRRCRKINKISTYKQTEDVERSIAIYQLHPQAIYTSRLLDLYLKENDYVSENLNELHIEEN
ncbi:23562_t:CDS:2, partial [Cetraspora pellucida]